MALSTARLMKSRRPALRDDTRAVAMVEFAIAIVPIFVCFFGTVQMCSVAYVSLMVKHAAFVAARAEAVIHPGMHDSGTEDDVKAGVMMLLGAIPGVTAADVDVQTESADPLSQKLDLVGVTLSYRCTVPLGNVIACPASRIMAITAAASFPNQGSKYQKIWNQS
jgi:Flp pilus assembly protein TadG